MIIKDLSISVSSGTGQAIFTVIGLLKGISIKAPSGAAQYDYEITDADGHGVLGATGVVGRAKASDEEAVKGANTFTISNATVDGTYQIRMWILFAESFKR